MLSALGGPLELVALAFGEKFLLLRFHLQEALSGYVFSLERCLVSRSDLRYGAQKGEEVHHQISPFLATVFAVLFSLLQQHFQP